MTKRFHYYARKSIQKILHFLDIEVEYRPIPSPSQEKEKVNLHTKKVTQEASSIKKEAPKATPKPKSFPISPSSQLRLPIDWVDSDEKLEEYCRKLADFEVLGVDCETTIHGSQALRLIQIACRKFIILIDPLSISNFRPLKRLLENPRITMVAHKASVEQYQLEKLKIRPPNVFDTLKASQKLRPPPPDFNGKWNHKLDTVCMRELSLSMDKGMQMSNWTQRPLSQKQLQYAALDAEVMIQLYDVFSGGMNPLFSSVVQPEN